MWHGKWSIHSVFSKMWNHSPEFRSVFQGYLRTMLSVFAYIQRRQFKIATICMNISLSHASKWLIHQQAQMCSTPLKRDCNHRCDHWPFAIVTTGVTTDHWPFTIVTTDLSLYSQFTLCSLKQQTDWHITNITLLLYLCMVKLSKNLDWSALPSFLLVSLNGPIHNPCSLIGQSEWAHASVWMSP